MPFDSGSVVASVLAAVGAIFWFARLEGRVNTQERLHADLKDDLKYIRRRLDAALGGSMDDE
jgi:hypothetical protein